ncbi:RNase H domain-containing protein [Aphis craccivora]|uniref:RNase H domain-containing protein n=1 Tax=Aphis craccivora TaxID=307492 RepID=A0A6G0VL47_APHCR|nr:RNase H domain-containing protein [Aphis craccivora]
MRIGHSSLTHQHLMKREDPPICTSCGTQLTIKHIITECRQFESEKRKAGVPLILAEALQPANIQNTISFIINSNLINLL